MYLFRFNLWVMCVVYTTFQNLLHKFVTKFYMYSLFPLELSKIQILEPKYRLDKYNFE